MIQFKNNFPRIDDYESKPDYRTLFPWGCDSLIGQTPISLPYGYFKAVKLRTPYNYYLAVKYGIWSFPFPMYILQYFVHDCLIAPFYLVFIWNNYFLGIAKIVKFQPQKSFKYFNFIDQDCKFDIFGSVKIKFIKIGRVQKQEHVDVNEVWINRYSIGKIIHQMNVKQVNLFQFRENDKYEEYMREYYKIEQNLSEFERRHERFTNKFDEFRSELDSLYYQYRHLTRKEKFKTIIHILSIKRFNYVKYVTEQQKENQGVEKQEMTGHKEYLK